MQDDLRFLDRGGRVARRILKLDWSGHPLGPVGTWDPALRDGLGTMFASSFPGFLVWGDAMTLFFNDLYEPMLGNKAHSLGSPFPAVWHEVWDCLGPSVKRVMAGESFFFRNYAVTLERHGYPELARFHFSYAPLRDAVGAVRGLFCTCVEITGEGDPLAPYQRSRAQPLGERSGANGKCGWTERAAQADARFARLCRRQASPTRAPGAPTPAGDAVAPDPVAAPCAVLDDPIACTAARDVNASPTTPADAGTSCPAPTVP
ncbi:hypothetical protein ACFPOU_02910 [Massilia jejuensis]|uniref:PAS domain-containing protein n=1 Tax=Massilia jejuensis TaxID=648894 RepID=A0ABW0PEV9_9BURK